MGFWKSVFGSKEHAPLADRHFEVITMMGTTWASSCAALCRAASPDASNPMTRARILLCCPNEDTAITLARECSPLVDHFLSRDISITIYEDGLASVEFLPDVTPETPTLNAEIVFGLTKQILQSPRFEGRNVIVQNGFIYPTTDEYRLNLMEYLRVGPDHAIVVGDSFVW